MFYFIGYLICTLIAGYLCRSFVHESLQEAMPEGLKTMPYLPVYYGYMLLIGLCWPIMVMAVLVGLVIGFISLFK